MPAVSAVDEVLALLLKARKKNSALGLPCLDCFARTASWNTTPSGVYLQYRRSSIAISADLDGQDHGQFPGKALEGQGI